MQFSVQCTSADSEQFGSAGAVSSALGESLDDDVFFVGLDIQRIFGMLQITFLLPCFFLELFSDCLADFDRDVIEGQRAAPGENDHSFDAVTQFPDISRPVVGSEHLDRFRGESTELFAIVFGGQFQVMVEQQRNVFAVFA